MTDHEAGTQKERAWEIPDSLGEWAGALSVILVLTGLVATPVVVGVMYLWLEVPSWCLAIAIVLIAGAATWLTLGPEVEDPPEDKRRPEDNEHWVWVRPEGVVGWLKHIGMILASWIGLNCVVNALVLDLVFGASDSTQARVSLGLLALAILLQTFDVVENDSASEPAAEHPDERPGLVDA